jgi:excisionase family DNA binding protein
MKNVFTTGEAAKLCRVSQQTIIRWTDAGKLKHFRITGSTHRRITREQLAAFAGENGMDHVTEALEQEENDAARPGVA